MKEMYESKELKNISPEIEHLNNPSDRIMAGIGTPKQFRRNPGEWGKKFQKTSILRKVLGMGSENKICDVDFYGNPETLEKEGFKNSGNYTYVFSPINDFDKISHSFKNCTGLLVVGRDKETKENISFLSHQNPFYFLDNSDDREKFLDDLRRQLAEIKEKSINKTIDAVLFGGNYSALYNEIDDTDMGGDYTKSIRLLANETSNVLGFEPMVVNGPKIVEGEDDVFFDNKNRRLYIMRPEVGVSSTEGFIPSSIEEQEKKW